MENTIELSDIVRKPNTAILMLKDLFKVIRLFVFLALMFLLVEACKYGYDQGLKKFEEAREAYVISYIEQDLQDKTFRFDESKGTEKQVKNMSKEQLLKAFWIINAQFEKRNETIQYIQDALNYNK